MGLCSWAGLEVKHFRFFPLVCFPGLSFFLSPMWKGAVSTERVSAKPVKCAFCTKRSLVLQSSPALMYPPARAGSSGRPVGREDLPALGRED